MNQQIAPCLSGRAKGQSLFPALAVAILLAGISGASAEPRSARNPEQISAALCAERFHPGIEAVGREMLPRIDAARDLALKGDESLPGRWIFTPRSVERSAEAQATLRRAASLMLARGRAAWAGDTDSRWIADRIRTDLSDYLTQGPSPFLCGGVASYLETLRSYAARLAPSPAAAEQYALTQQEVIRMAFAALVEAASPVPVPRFAERAHEAPSTGDAEPAATVKPEGLRLTSHGIDGMSVKRRPIRFGPHFDPDLPPIAMVRAEQRPLSTEPQRLSLLIDATAIIRKFGVLPEGAERSMLHAGRNGGDRPVLASLAALKDALDQAPAGTFDPLVRKRFVELASALEALDYLSDSRSRDTLGETYEATFTAIEEALDDARGGAASVASVPRSDGPLTR